MRFKVLLIVLFLSFISVASAADYTYNSNERFTLREFDRAVIYTGGGTNMHTLLVGDYIQDEKVALKIDGTSSDGWIFMSEGGIYVLSNGTVLRVEGWEFIGDELQVSFKLVSEFEQQQELEAIQKRRQNLDHIYLFFFFGSVAVGIIITVFLVRKGSFIPSFILHGLLFLSSIIWLISAIVSSVAQWARLGGVVDPDVWEIGWPFIVFFFVSGYIIWNLIRQKREFSKKYRYALGLSTGFIITTLLGLLTTVVAAFFMEWDGLGFGLAVVFMFLLGSIATFIGVIVGLVVDKRRAVNS